MNEERLKLIIQNMELLLEALKKEIYTSSSTQVPPLNDYDEVYDEEDDN